MSKLNSTIKRSLLTGTVPVSCGTVAIEFAIRREQEIAMDFVGLMKMGTVIRTLIPGWLLCILKDTGPP